MVYFKKPLFLILLITTQLFGKLEAQNIEFKRKNFPDQNKELAKALSDIRLGDADFEIGYFKTATKHYLKAYNFNQSNASLNYRLGVCYFNTKKDSLAKKRIIDAYELNKKVAEDIEYYLARSYHLSAQFDSAKQHYSNYLTILDSYYENESEKTKLTKFIAECDAGLLVGYPQGNNLKFQNLGKRINSVQDDYSAFYLKTGQSLIYTSSRNYNAENLFREDVFIADLAVANHESKSIGNSINTDENEAIIGVSEKTGRIFLHLSNDPVKIYYSEKSGDKWTRLKPFDWYPDFGAEITSLCFSPNEDSIYFISDLRGNNDIFMSSNRQDSWSSPLLLDTNTINTPYDEASVWYADNTLYFSSKGHNTIGGFDVFSIKKDKKGNWSDPQSLGLPYNSPYDDLYYKPYGDKSFLVSNRYNGFGKADIYQIETIITYMPNYDSLKTELNKYVIINNISFEVNLWEIDTLSENLEMLSGYLLDNPDVKIKLIGHTDKQGPKLFNKVLSQKRAEFISAYLLGKKVPGSQIVTTSKSDSLSIAKNKNDKGRYIWDALKYNRRVQIEVVQQGKNRQLLVKPITVPEKYAVAEQKWHTWSILLKMSDKPLGNDKFGGIPGIQEKETKNKDYFYFFGTFDTKQLAINRLNQLKNKYPEAFVFLNIF